MAQARQRTSQRGRTSRRGRARPTRASPTPEGSEPTAPEAGSGPVVCTVGFCPICLAVTTVNQARPDLVEHLLVAGQEILLAVRSIIDARLEASEPPAKLERLTIE